MGKKTMDLRPVVLFATLLLILSGSWLACVNATVDAPYLDEFFHVRQALVYFRTNDWWLWDPKITTPPGLYLISYLVLHVMGVPSASSPSADSSSTNLELLRQLRKHNFLGLLLCFVVLNGLLYSRPNPRPRSSFSAAFTAFNITLFPPLFFFSGLYYTDILSVLVVLKAYETFHHRQPGRTLLYSLLSLWFRQTNVFWTAIYLGSLEAYKVLAEQQGSGERVDTRDLSWRQCVISAWNDGLIYDLPIDEANLHDYIKLVLSLALSAVRNVPLLIQRVLPQLITLGAFGGFVLWNGGVVLGDRSNHIASLHLPQMLYIWPYIVFFSWPVLLPSLLPTILSYLPQSIVHNVPRQLTKHTTSTAIRISSYVRQPRKRPSNLLASILTAILLLISTLLIIHYNTLIHPFTLADNRHYTFYIFRIFFLRVAWARYLYAPIYLLCAWACIHALSQSDSSPLPQDTSNTPSDTPSNKQSNTPAQNKPQTYNATASKTRSSTLLLWLLPSVLSLATAPLVEPRYFLLPWIFWRLNINIDTNTKKNTGAQSGTATWTNYGTIKKPTQQEQQQQQQQQRRWWRWAAFVDNPFLLLEMSWYLAINAVTGWIFLNRVFEWPDRPGEKMRFMW